MNFKKFISGVGALAIAASAFAGIAVTASAASATTNEDGTVTVSGINPAEDTYFDDAGEAYPDAAELSVSRGYNGSSTYVAFAAMRFDIASILTEYSNYVISKAELVVDAKRNQNNATTLYVGAVPAITADIWTDGLTRSEWISEFKNNNASSAGEKSLSNDYASYAIDVTRALSVTDTDGDVTFQLYTNNSGRRATVASLENTAQNKPELKITFAPKVAITSATVKYVNKDDSSELTSIDYTDDIAGSYVYDKYFTYAYPAYFVSSDKKSLYVYDGSAYSKTIQVTEAAPVYTENYKADTTYDNALEYKFVEFSGKASHRGSAASGNAVQAINNAATVSPDSEGVYTVVAKVYNRANSAKDVNITKGEETLLAGDRTNNASDGYLSGNTGAAGKILKIENVTLKQGESISIKGNDGNVDLDYVLLVKTDELPAEAVLNSVTDVETFEASADVENDTAVTAAVLNVTVSNGPAKVAVSYNESAEQVTGTTLSGSAVIGVIVNAVETLATDNFAVRAVVE